MLKNTSITTRVLSWELRQALEEVNTVFHLEAERGDTIDAILLFAICGTISTLNDLLERYERNPCEPAGQDTEHPACSPSPKEQDSKDYDYVQLHLPIFDESL